MTQSTTLLGAGVAELETTDSTPQALSHDLTRLGSGLALSAVFGLALGARGGGMELLRHALGAPLGLLVSAGVAAPALFVRLSLMDAPVRPLGMLSAVSRATFSAGLVLAGLAPAMTMLVVSIESREAAASLSSLGLLLAGSIGLSCLFADLQSMLASSALTLRSRALLSVAVFAVLACALSARVWGAWLPLLGGGK